MCFLVFWLMGFLTNCSCANFQDRNDTYTYYIVVDVMVSVLDTLINSSSHWHWFESHHRHSIFNCCCEFLSNIVCSISVQRIREDLLRKILRDPYTSHSVWSDPAYHWPLERFSMRACSFDSKFQKLRQKEHLLHTQICQGKISNLTN
jgi:hypothetical protein